MKTREQSQRELRELLRDKEKENPPRRARICRECGLACNYSSDGDELCDDDYNSFEFSKRRAFNVAGDGVICEECFCWNVSEESG